MAKTPVTTTLEEPVYSAWKASGLKLNHVIKLGLMSAQQTPGYLGRIRELEEGNAKLQKKLTFVLARLNELESNQ